MKKWSSARSILVTGTAVFVSLAVHYPALSQTQSERFTLGERSAIRSKVLNEERPVLVYLPLEYETPSTRYPVLYLLDGSAHFLHVSGLVEFLAAQGLMEPMIVVAVPNTDRRRDLSPTSVAALPGSGGADRFLQFFRQELIPFVEKTYRTLPYRILVGHSLGGQFAVHSMLTQPDVFDAYIAISPWLVYDGGEIVGRARTVFGRGKKLDKFLFISVGNEQKELLDTIKQFIGILEADKPEGMEWKYAYYGDDDHGSVVHISIYDGLRALYAGWRLPRDLVALGVDGIKAHYEGLSRRFGYEIALPEAAFNVLGYQLAAQGNYQEAVKVLVLNAELFPTSPNVYDSLGEAYEAFGKLNKARRNFRKAVALAEKSNHSLLQVYKEHLARVEEKRQPSPGAP